MKRWRIRRIADLKGGRSSGSAHLPMTRRALLVGGISACAFFGTSAQAQSAFAFSVVDGKFVIRRGKSKVVKLDPTLLGDKASFHLGELDNTVWIGAFGRYYRDLTVRNLHIGSFKQKKLEFRIDRSGTGSRWFIFARLPDDKKVDRIPFERWAFSKDWSANGIVPVLFADDLLFLQRALSGGVSVVGKENLEIFLRSDLGWVARAGSECSLHVEGVKVNKTGIQFGRQKVGGQAPFLRGDARGEGELSLGGSADIEAVLRFGDARVVMRREAQGPRHSSNVTGAGILRIRRKSDRKTLADFEAEKLEVSVERKDSADPKATTTRASVWLKDKLSEVVVDGVPLTVLSQAAGPDFRIEASSGTLTLFSGQLDVQQLCLSVPGADFSRLTCDKTPLRFEVEGVATGAAAESATEDASGAESGVGQCAEHVACPKKNATAAARSGVVRFGAVPQIEFPLDWTELDVKRYDDLLQLKFRFADLSLFIANRQVYLASTLEDGDPDRTAVMAVDFPPQHVAERVYFHQERNNDRDVSTTCQPPVLSYGYPLRTDPLFSEFVRHFDAVKPSEVAGISYEGPDTLSHAEYSKQLQDAADNALALVMGKEKPEDIVPARLSGESTLAFRIPYNRKSAAGAAGGEGAAPKDRFTVAFDLDRLTDWRELRLAVVRRAEANVPDGFLPTLPGTPSEAWTYAARRLAYQGIDSAAKTGPDRLKTIFCSLQAPTCLETKIELPFRLMLSPSSEGSFLTPRRPRLERGGGMPVALWSADLNWDRPIERRGIGEVRAVWSTDFRPGVFGEGKAPPPHGAKAPWTIGVNDTDATETKEPEFRTGLDAGDRHDLVVLSSVPGLPVVAAPGDDQRLTGDQFSPPPDYVLEDLKTDEGRPATLQAIYDPQPLGVRELALTSLGGNLDLDATFDPPYAEMLDPAPSSTEALKTKTPLFPVPTVERWRQRTVLGRDILVEVAYKGFLFPIGHRCSLVKLTERVFEPHPRGGHPTAYLKQRMFLRVSKPTKSYPAVGQPFDGRAWPARSVTLVAGRSPDIVDPYGGFALKDSALEPAGFALSSHGRLLKATPEGKKQPLAGLVFWPRTGACDKGEVKFEIRIDGSSESVWTPLLFVDTRAVQSSLKDVVAYYNALQSDPKAIAEEPKGTGARAVWNHGGAMRRYAAETESGDTSVMSLQWLIGAEGLYGEGAEGAKERAKTACDAEPLAELNSNYTVTSILAAADQPPFYPRLRSAQVRVQAFERLVGRPTPPVIATYLPNYIRNGFESGESNTFLRLRSGDGKASGNDSIRLDFSGDKLPPTGNRGGGVSQPNMTVNALSRALGPVFLTTAETCTPPGAVAAVNVNAVLTAAGESKDVAASIDKLLGNSKILGLDLIKLVGLTQAEHPQLKETLIYGVGGKELDAASGALTKVLGELLTRFDTDLTRQDDAALLMSFYPDLAASKEELKEALKKNVSEVEKIGLAVGPARRFAAALGRAAADPLAPVRDGARDAFRRLLAGLLWAEASKLTAAIANVKEKFRETIKALLISSDLRAWRRIVLGLPSVHPDFAKELGHVDTAVDQLWRTAVNGKFSGDAIVATKDALSEFARLYIEYLDAQMVGAAEKLSAEALAELEAALRRAKRFSTAPYGVVAQQFAKTVAELERTIQSLDPVVLSADPLRLLERLGELGISIVGLAGTQIPTLLKSGLQDVCAGAAEALTLVTASALQTEAAVDAKGKLSGLSQRLKDMKGHIDQQKTWPDAVRTYLAEWVTGRAAQVDLLQADLNAALSVLASFNVGSLHSDACKAPDATPFAILQDIDDARRTVLVSARNALGQTEALIASFQTGLDGLRGVIAERLEEVAEEKRAEVKKSLDAAVVELEAALVAIVRDWSRAAVVVLDASTPLGAVADAGQAKAVATVTAFLGQVSDAIDPRSADAPGRSDTLKETLAAVAAAKTFFDALPSVRKNVDQAVSDFAKSATTVKAAKAAAEKLNATLKDIIGAQEASLQQAVQTARGLLLASSPKIVSGILGSVSPVVAGVLSAIVAVNDQVERERGRAIKALDPTGGNGAGPGEEDSPLDVRNRAGLAALLKLLPGATDVLRCPFYVQADPKVACLDSVNPDQMGDALDLEGQLLVTLIKRLESESPLKEATVDELRTLAGEWRENGLAVARLVRQILDLTRSILSGDLGRVVDLADLKAKLENELRQLLPLKSQMHHKLMLKIDPTDAFLAKVFLPTDKPGTLKIDTTSTFHFGLPKPKVESLTTGTLSPFSIKLLGDLNIATLEFSGATFEVVDDGSPKFTIAFKSFKSGEAIKFIEPIQKFLSPGESGPRIEALKDAPGVSASYSVDIGIISIGAVSFANVLLNAVAELPFGNDKARFRVGLGRRDAPFLISALPYTGGGYFSLIATGEKIVGFEASFEFGGGGAFQFGPLKGQGRITTGIFIRQSGEGAYMDGFFYCGGSARIAFFGTSASLSVRMTHVNGKMSGEATFKYAFSLGIRDFEYSVRVNHQRDGLAQQASLHVFPTVDHAALDISPLTGRIPQSLMQMPPVLRLAGLGGGAAAAAADTCEMVAAASFKLAAKAEDDLLACQVNTAACQSRNWLTYKDYFDFGLLKKVPLDD